MRPSTKTLAPVKAGKSKNQLGYAILSATLARLVLNTARRFIYPFAPELSRGLDVPMTAITSLIAINQFTAVIGIVFGLITDYLGYRRVMAAGMVFMILGMIGGGLFSSYLFILLAMFMAGLGKTTFDPAIQAYVGKQVPYYRRGRAVGIVEMSWAGSSLIGIPLVGIVMQQSGWQSAFWLIGAAGAICLLGIFRLIPADPDRGSKPFSIGGTLKSWRELIGNRPALGTIGFGFFISWANDNLFVVYGAWMEADFGLGLASLGLATAIIGGAELCGEGLTVLVSDRMGLRKAAIVGAILTTIAYLLMIGVGASLVLALPALFVLFLAFEFTIVTTVSLSTELHPSARATMMAGFFAVGALGRVIGALTGGLLWTISGWKAVCIVSAVTNTLGVLALIWGMKHRAMK